MFAMTVFPYLMAFEMSTLSDISGYTNTNVRSTQTITHLFSILSVLFSLISMLTIHRKFSTSIEPKLIM